MEWEGLRPFLALSFLMSILFGLFLIAYEDGIPLANFKKLRCKLGFHKNIVKIGKAKINRYYCQFCKKPRRHPPLTLIDGGKKFNNNRFKF